MWRKRKREAKVWYERKIILEPELTVQIKVRMSTEELQQLPSWSARCPPSHTFLCVEWESEAPIFKCLAHSLVLARDEEEAYLASRRIVAPLLEKTVVTSGSRLSGRFATNVAGETIEDNGPVWRSKTKFKMVQESLMHECLIRAKDRPEAEFEPNYLTGGCVTSLSQKKMRLRFTLRNDHSIS